MSDMPQFSTAEYARLTIERCRLCNTPLATEYYRVRGQSACADCAAAARSGQASAADNTVFSRAVLFGIAAAIAGLASYAAFTIATNFYIGYVALGVGYIIARAMKAGSGGLGGRRYQIIAVILTYLAIALAEIPIGLWQLHAKATAGRLLVAGIQLLPIGLISPILEMRSPVHGLINLVILYVGLRIAWRGTAATRATVEGPYHRLTTTAN
jgi:hypothetical protein